MKNKPSDKIAVEFKPSGVVMTPQNVDRIQDRIVDMFVRDYFQEEPKGIKSGIRGASFIPPSSDKDA